MSADTKCTKLLRLYQQDTVVLNTKLTRNFGKTKQLKEKEFTADMAKTHDQELLLQLYYFLLYSNIPQVSEGRVSKISLKYMNASRPLLMRAFF